MLGPGVRIQTPKGEAGEERSPWGGVAVPCPQRRGGFMALTEEKLALPVNF